MATVKERADVRTRLRRAIALGAGCLLAAAPAGCSAVPGFAAGPATPSASAAPLSTSPVRVLTVAVPRPRTPAPALRTTGTAWPAILASLAGYGQWLLANPDPTLVATVAEPGCGAANLTSQQVAGLLRDRVFATVSGPVGSTVGALGNTVLLDVTVSRPLEPVLSRTGKPVTAFGALPLTALRITLFRPADKKWRLCTVDRVPGTALPGDPPVSLL